MHESWRSQNERLPCPDRGNRPWLHVVVGYPDARWTSAVLSGKSTEQLGDREA